MLTRLTLTAAALAALAGVAAAEPPAPAVVVQVKPVSRVLTDLKEMIRQVGGPAMGNDMVKEFEGDLKRGLGDKGFEGLDVNRPIAVYVVLKEKPEDAAAVVLLPATDEKELLGFLERIQIQTEAVKDKKGVYKLALPEELFPKASHLQFADGGWAYLTLNDGEPTDPKNLVPVGELLKDAGPALVAAKVYPGRVPAKMAADALDQLDQTAGMIKGFLAAGQGPEMKVLRTFLEQGPKLVRRYAETALKEVDEVGLTFTFDAAGGDTVTELTVAPKAGTPTAKAYAAVAPTTNRFAGVLGKNAAFGLTLKAPLFAGEVREITTSAIEAIQGGLQKESDIPEKLKPVIDEAAKGFLRCVKAEKLDAAFGLVGPDKGGKFVFLAAVSFDDTAALEKAMREAAKDSTLAKEFEFDAAKVGDVTVHRVPLMKLFPPEAERDLPKVLGEQPQAYVAFAKDAVFLAFGAGALDAVKAAAAAKPGPAPAMDLAWNNGRIQKFAAAMDERAGAEVAKALGTDDKTASALKLTVAGGQNLKVTLTFNVRYIPQLMVTGAGARAEFQPVPPPVAVPAKN